MNGWIAAYPHPLDERVIVTTEVWCEKRSRAANVIRVMLKAGRELPSRPQG